MPAYPVYTYRQVAERVAEELGVRPSLSALRASSADQRRTRRRDGLPRVTLGMPAPMQRTSPTAPATFSQAKVELWLRQHPRRKYAEAIAALTRSATGSTRSVEEAVRRARRSGVSWRDVSAALTAGAGKPVSRVQAYERFRHIDVPHQR